MFPWVYGFTWTLGNIIFLGIFFSVVAIIGTTLVLTIFRSLRSMKPEHAEAIRWESDFHDLPVSLRSCRHEFTGEFKQRHCDNGFDCRQCTTHAKLVEHQSTNSDAIELPIQAYGFTIPTDRLYHRGHTWVKQDAVGTYTIGLDDFASRMIGTPDGITMPKPGTRLRLNGSAWSLQRGKHSMRILSPLDGEVVATGDGSEGWYLKIRPITPEVNTAHLLRDTEVAPWLQREFERVQNMLADKNVGVTLADGGTPVRDFSQAFPEKNWDTIFGDVFLEA